ncbi:MAG: phosphatidate cytidylyltransferase [Promethearchaeota archaeon]
MNKWDIVAGFYNTTFTLFFFICAFLTIIVAYRGYKAKNTYGASSTALCAVFFIFFGYYNNIFWFLPYPFCGFMVWWIGIVLGFYIIFALIIRRIIKKMKSEENKKQDKSEENGKKHNLKNYIEQMTDENPYKEDISMKMETIRKSFHLAGLLFIFSYFWFIVPIPVATHVNNGIIDYIKETEWVYNIMWGDIHEQYPYYKGDQQAVIDLTLFALIGALVLTILSDFIRVLWGPEYSAFNFLTKAVLRKKEYNAAGPQIYLLTGMIFSYILFLEGFVNIWIILTAILIACFSDAAAALVGRKFGKHKVKCVGGDIKSWEGFLAGAGSAFIIGLIVGPFGAIVCALIFFLLDYFPTVIADNILNPIAITLGLGLFFWLTGLPIGWS